MGQMRISQAGKRARSQGFTLIELLVVLLILGICVAVTAQTITRRSPSLQLRSGVATAVATLREARSLAIRDNREVQVLVDVSARSLRLGPDGAERLFDPELGISLYTAAMEIESRDSGAVRFFPDGTSAGGRIRLSSETQTYDVFIDWLTGSIYVQ